jgi:hypothetical protein
MVDERCGSSNCHLDMTRHETRGAGTRRNGAIGDDNRANVSALTITGRQTVLARLRPNPQRTSTFRSPSLSPYSCFRAGVYLLLLHLRCCPHWIRFSLPFLFIRFRSVCSPCGRSVSNGRTYLFEREQESSKDRSRCPFTATNKNKKHQLEQPQATDAHDPLGSCTRASIEGEARCAVG